LRHSGAVIFGGPMSANDPDDFVKQEIDWISVPLAEEKPFLGICLGAQMMAKNLGGRVDPHPQGAAEIGYYPIRPTDAGRQACPDWPCHVYQWHREGFDLPRGAELLAEGDLFEVQAFRYGPSAYAVQFHPEVTHAMMCRWTTRAHERLSLPMISASGTGCRSFSTGGSAPRRGRFACRPATPARPSDSGGRDGCDPALRLARDTRPLHGCAGLNRRARDVV
jgi:GMP synthase-like glutamine amidotransferase